MIRRLFVFGLLLTAGATAAEEPVAYVIRAPEGWRIDNRAVLATTSLYESTVMVWGGPGPSPGITLRWLSDNRIQDIEAPRGFVLIRDLSATRGAAVDVSRNPLRLLMAVLGRVTAGNPDVRRFLQATISRASPGSAGDWRTGVAAATEGGLRLDGLVSRPGRSVGVEFCELRATDEKPSCGAQPVKQVRLTAAGLPVVPGEVVPGVYQVRLWRMTTGRAETPLGTVLAAVVPASEFERDRREWEEITAGVGPMLDDDDALRAMLHAWLRAAAQGTGGGH